MKISRILIDFLLRARFSGHFDFCFLLPFFIWTVAFFAIPVVHHFVFWYVIMAIFASSVLWSQKHPLTFANNSFFYTCNALMQPWKVTFFALFLTSNIITMLVRNLVHGYKHDSATGFVCFAYFPLSFGCPWIFFLGILELVCFFTLFCFCYIGASLGAEGEYWVCVSRTGPNPLFMQDGEEGNIENLGLVPYSHLNYFHFFHIENL